MMIAPKLQSGDKVAVIPISNTITHIADTFNRACANFARATGLVVVPSKHVLAQHYYSAGTVAERLEDFNWALGDPEIKAIIFAVGGNTAIELVDKLDYAKIAAQPKIIAGISDATTLLEPITHKTGLITFLGIEFIHFADHDMSYEVEYIKRAWFDGQIGEIAPNPAWKDFTDQPTQYQGWDCIRPGKASGKVVGGNFSSFTQLMPVNMMQPYDGNILFIERYMANKKNLHQSFTQLRLWGVMDQIAGLVIGYCVGSDRPGPPGNERTIRDIILEVSDGYDFPVMQIGEVGHNVENIMLPIGAKIEMDAEAKRLTVLEPVAG